jgi:hypothetical protein
MAESKLSYPCPKCENSLEEGGCTTETLEKGVNTDTQATAIMCNNCLSIIGVLPKITSKRLECRLRSTIMGISSNFSF